MTNRTPAPAAVPTAPPALTTDTGAPGGGRVRAQPESGRQIDVFDALFYLTEVGRAIHQK